MYPVKTEIPVFFTTFLLLFLAVQSGKAQNRGLDLAFGDHGIAKAPNQPNLSAWFTSMALTPGGKILAGGDGAAATKVACYLPDGTIDISFGNNGNFLQDPARSRITVNSIVLQPDGKILAAGKMAGSQLSGIDSFLIFRLTAQGLPDITFGNNGYAVNYVGNSRNNCIYSLHLQQDGKILAAGTIGYSRDMGLARYLPDGKPDTSFHHTGYTRISNGSYGGPAFAVGTLADGRILVGGWGDDSTTYEGFMAMRFLPHGVLDTSYNHNGKAYQYVPGGLAGYVRCALIQPDGKVLVGGNTDKLTLVRFDTSGHPDTTLAQTGIYKHIHNYNVRALVLQSDGKILVGGDNDTDILLTRIRTNGQTDSSFGDQGIITTDVQSFTDMVRAVVIQPDGKIVAAGEGRNSTSLSGNAVIVRYKQDAATSVPAVMPNTADIQVHPNPANRTLTVTNKTNIPFAAIELISPNGLAIWSRKHPADHTAINVAGFNPGVYLIRCTLNSGRIITKRALLQR